MPMNIRPSEMSCSVAYPEASTVGSRVPGFVTQCPNRMRFVARRARVSSGNDSCHSTWESYVQPWSKPHSSASVKSSTNRAWGGSGRTVTPNFSAMGPPRSRNPGSVGRVRWSRQELSPDLPASADGASRRARPDDPGRRSRDHGCREIRADRVVSMRPAIAGTVVVAATGWKFEHRPGGRGASRRLRHERRADRSAMGAPSSSAPGS